MIIFKAKFERVKEEMEIKLPTEPLYYLSSRKKSIRLIPVYTTWNIEKSNKPECIWRYDCTVVDLHFTTSIERFHIGVTERDFQDVVDKQDRSNYSIREEIYHKLINFPNDYLRTKEQFDADLQAALDNITRPKL